MLSYHSHKTVVMTTNSYYQSSDLSPKFKTIDHVLPKTQISWTQI